MASWGGARRGAGRKPKTLLQRIEDGSFSTDRHAHLLGTDDSLLEVELAANDPRREQFARLIDLQLLFRSVPRSYLFGRRGVLRKIREELDR